MKWVFTLIASFLFVFQLGFSKSGDDARLANYKKHKIDEYDRQIRHLEKKYLKLEGRKTFRRKAKLYYASHFNTPEIIPSNKVRTDHTSDFSQFSGEKSSYRIDKYILVENCFIGVSIQVYDKKNKLVKVEEGPINLREVTKMHNIEYKPDESLAYQISFDTKKIDYPELYYSSRKKRAKAFAILDEMRSLCQERYALARELNLSEFSSNEANSIKDLSIPISKEMFARPVRYFSKAPIKAALLTNGEQGWIGRLSINRHANKPGDSILLQTLIFMADEAGLYWSEDLISRRRKGVHVEVFIDALSPFLDVRDLTVRDNTKKMYNNLMASGIKVYGFRCGNEHRLLDEISLSRRYHSKAYDQRPHEKIWIVNNKYTIVGGMNIGNDYFRLNKLGFGFWRDQDILVKSKELATDFTNIFNGNTASYVANYLDPKEDSCFNPYDPIREAVSYEQFYMSHRKDYELKRSRFEKQEIQAYARAKIREYSDAFENKTNWSLKFHDIKAIRAVHNRPKLHELHIENTYLDIINHAREEIIISNAYYIPSIQIKKALRRAANRGVRVMILTNSYNTNDVPPVAILARHTYKEMVDFNYGSNLKNGREIEIYEWMGDENNDGVLEQGTNHAKFIVVDRKVAFIGSYNLDPRSRDINSEIGAVVESQELSSELADEFLHSDLRFSKRVSYSDMIHYRKPVSVLQAAWLKMQGGYKDFNLADIGKKRFFYHIAHYNESTW